MHKKTCRKIKRFLGLFLTIIWVSTTSRAVAKDEGMVNAEIAQQTVSISGKVLDTDGDILLGVSVLVKGTTNGTTTGADGKYSVTVPGENAILTFSYIGFKPFETIVGNRRVIDVILEEDMQFLDEIIVTGFGNLNRATYTGSASFIGTDNQIGIPNLTVASIIQANAPGVQISTNSSQPGSVIDMRIRGVGSFTSGLSTPLYVIDGIPVVSGDVSATSRSGTGGTDIMATLNPNDISNITIIKDAAAASLYGSRAANGVILITTKQGDRNKMRVSFSSDFGQSDFAYAYRPFMGGEERRQFIYDAYMRRGMYVEGLSETDAIAYADKKRDEDTARDRPRWSVEPWSGWTNWLEEGYRKGSHDNQEISISGGSDKITYYSSLSHSNSKGVQKVQELGRFTGRVNIVYDAKPWLRIGNNLMFADTKQRDGAESSGDYSSPSYAVFIKLTPSDTPFQPDGSYTTNAHTLGGNARNVVAYNELDKRNMQVTRAFNTVYTELTPLQTLKFRTTFSYDYSISRGYTFEHPLNDQSGTAQGRVGAQYNERRQMVWSSNANYIKTFGANHNVNALIAYEITDNYQNSLSGSGTNFANYNYIQVSNATENLSTSGSYNEDRLVSIISKADYNWKHRYYVGASFRRDGTSRLHADSRWGNFWSASGAWRFTDEGFMAGIKNFITDGKLRISYGVNGNRPSGRYSYLSTATITGGYNGQNALRESSMADRLMKWESNYTLNMGLDLTIIKRIDLSLEVYDRTTKDLFRNLQISQTTGYSSISTNIGSISNRGLELTINSQNIRSKDFAWNSQFNISHNKNKILDMGPFDERSSGGIGSSTIQRVGHPFYEWYVIEFSHINPENGRAMFFTNTLLPDGTRSRELTDNGDLAQQIPYKSPYPKATMGLSNNIRWKFVDLSFTFSSTFGGHTYDRGGDKTETSGALDGLVNQIHIHYRDSWKKPGDTGKLEFWIPENTDTYAMLKHHNSRRVHSTDHIRLKNLNLGVTLPQEWANAIRVANVRVYCTGSNLWTLAAFDMYDPELTGGDSGVVSYETPPLKSWSLGINITF